MTAVKKKKKKRVLFVRTVCYLKRNVNEEYSMLRIKNKSLDVPNLVYKFCHHSSSFTGPKSVLFLGPCLVKHLAVCWVLLTVSDLLAVHGLKYVSQSVELLYKVF